MSLEEQKSLESQYVMNTFARKPVEFVSGMGCTLKDDAGREYLDFIGGIGACSLGHCHPALVNALKTQAETLIHVSNYYYIEKRGQVSQKLSAMLNAALPAEKQQPWKTFYANSGAEANECSIKLARLYARKKFVAAGGNAEEAPRTVVVMERSFHGRTLATLAATAQAVKQELFQPLPSGFVPTPMNDVEALEQLFEQKGSQICAVMLEVIQGESGVHPVSQEYFEAVDRLAKRYGALIICDEVQCGIYRCGTYPYAFQHYGITPDIVSMAKGIAGGFPCGASSARADVADAFEPGVHGSTFGGSNLAIAAISATLAAIEDEGVADHVAKVGAYFAEKLAELPHVAEVRGKGLMLAIELDASAEKTAPQIVADALEAGFVLNYTGPTTMRFLPPLVVTEADIDALIGGLKDLIK